MDFGGKNNNWRYYKKTMINKLVQGLKFFFKHFSIYPTDTKGGFRFNFKIKF